MRTDWFMENLYTPRMRQYVIDTARTFSRNREIQKDLVQEAWLRVCQLEEDKTDEYYRREAYRTMDAFHHREGEYEELEHKLIERAQMGEPQYGRPMTGAERKRRYRLRKKMQQTGTNGTPAPPI